MAAFPRSKTRKKGEAAWCGLVAFRLTLSLHNQVSLQSVALRKVQLKLFEKWKFRTGFSNHLSSHKTQLVRRATDFHLESKHISFPEVKLATTECEVPCSAGGVYVLRTIRFRWVNPILNGTLLVMYKRKWGKIIHFTSLIIHYTSSGVHCHDFLKIHMSWPTVPRHPKRLRSDPSACLKAQGHARHALQGGDAPREAPHAW